MLAIMIVPGRGLVRWSGGSAKVKGRVLCTEKVVPDLRKYLRSNKIQYPPGQEVTERWQATTIVPPSPIRSWHDLRSAMEFVRDHRMHGVRDFAEVPYDVAVGLKWV